METECSLTIGLIIRYRFLRFRLVPSGTMLKNNNVLLLLSVVNRKVLRDSYFFVRRLSSNLLLNSANALELRKSNVIEE